MGKSSDNNMDKEKIFKLLTGGNAYLQVPIEFQIALLGLDSKTIKKLKGKTGLDIACGKGFLVEELRKKGILFEGIDLEAPKDKPYFILQNITNVHPLIGSIPKQDNSYEIVTAFQCNVLNRGFTQGGTIRTAIENAGSEIQDDWHTTRYQHAQSTLYEAIRVAKPGCKVVVYPSLTRLKETIGPLLKMQGINFYLEPVDKKIAREYLKTESPIDVSLIPDEYFKTFGLLERTILVKDK